MSILDIIAIILFIIIVGGLWLLIILDEIFGHHNHFNNDYCKNCENKENYFK